MQGVLMLRSVEGWDWRGKPRYSQSGLRHNVVGRLVKEMKG